MEGSAWRRQGGEALGKPTLQHGMLYDGEGWKVASILTNTIAQIDDQPDTDGENGPNAAVSDDMSNTDRYIDARLAGIESKLDARADAMQRFTEQAEARMERFSEQAEARNAKSEERFERITRQLHEDFIGARQEMVAESKATRRHVSIMSATTIGAVLAGFAIIATLSVGWMSDQSAWLRDSVNRIEQRIDAPPTQAAPAPPAQNDQGTPPGE